MLSISFRSNIFNIAKKQHILIICFPHPDTTPNPNRLLFVTVCNKTPLLFEADNWFVRAEKQASCY